MGYENKTGAGHYYINCRVYYLYHRETGQFVKVWGIVLISFYILGCVAKLVLDHNFKEETEEATEEAAEGLEDGEGQEAGTEEAVPAEEIEQ